MVNKTSSITPSRITTNTNGATTSQTTFDKEFICKAVEDFASKFWQEGTHTMGATKDKQSGEYQISVHGTDESNANLPDYYEFQNQKVKVIKEKSSGQSQKL
ncbi:MAG: hypothetical protein HY094_08990 [Candidatus Melainabacteria bacterium]|nr:hypothetical protein [Candidatus Melainabacteria bacterium]